jgi:hypothetical protein
MLTFSLNFALAVAGVPTCESSVIRKRKLSLGWGGHSYPLDHLDSLFATNLRINRDEIV